jgi:hypothetical protein
VPNSSLGATIRKPFHRIQEDYNRKSQPRRYDSEPEQPATKDNPKNVRANDQDWSQQKTVW